MSAGEENLGVSVCGVPYASLDVELQARRARRIAQGAPTIATIRDIETTTFRPLPAGSEVSAEGIERLRRLCQLWDVTLRPSSITSHRTLIGPIIIAMKKILFRALHFLLKDTLHQQRSFNAEVIRALAEMSVIKR